MDSEQIQQISVNQITCRAQVRDRFDENAIIGLAMSLKSVGQLTPVRLRREGDTLIVVDGERRFRACLKAGLPTLAAIIEEKSLCDGEIIHRQLVANCQRVDLSPMEKARAIARLIETTGWNAGEAATQLGMSNASVTRVLALLTLPESVIREVESGRISASTAYEIGKLDDPKKQNAFIEQAVNGRLTREAVTSAAKQEKRRRSESSPPSIRKASVCLESGSSVIVVGNALDFESFIANCESALAKAKAAIAQSLSFQAFLKMTREQAKA